MFRLSCFYLFSVLLILPLHIIYTFFVVLRLCIAHNLVLPSEDFIFSSLQHVASTWRAPGPDVLQLRKVLDWTSISLQNCA